MKLDETDKEIVHLLQSNGRLTHEQVAREVHLSRPAVHERVRRMEQAGVIQAYGVQVDWEAVGLPLTAFIWVRTSLSCLSAGQTILMLTSKHAVVEECHRVAGEWCLLVKTHSASSLALQDLLDRISAIPDVQNIMTTVVLSTISESPVQKNTSEIVCEMPDGSGASRNKEVGLLPSGNSRSTSNESGNSIIAAAQNRRRV